MATETKLRQLAQGGCPVYYFYSSERYLVRQAVARAAKLLAEGEDEETTVLDGAAPEIEQLIMAAGTISFFGTRRVVLLPEVDPAASRDKDLDELWTEGRPALPATPAWLLSLIHILLRSGCYALAGREVQQKGKIFGGAVNGRSTKKCV